MSFRRIHLAALIADWRRTLLSVIGVALGVTVVLGTLILKSELARPFDSFGPSLTHAADTGVVEVTPNVSGRLPIETVNRLRAEVAGAEAVIPIVAGLTPVDVAGGSHGFFLLGGSCQIELLVGSFNCEQRARDVKPADGPGVPLQIPTVIAQRHGLQLGEELRIPGLPPGSAHLGWTFPEFDRVEGINDGYVLLAPSADIAASMLGSPGYATAAFVLPKHGAVSPTSRPTSTASSPASQRLVRPGRTCLPCSRTRTQSFNLTVLAGIIVGVLIAVNTILLAVEDRRAVMGTIGAIGAKPVGLFGGMLGEGAVVGVLGGLLGVPSGFLLGTYLVDRFGQSMLAGSGGTIAAHFTPNLIVIGAAAGIVCGILAMIGPAVRLVRDGPLASMASVGGSAARQDDPDVAAGRRGGRAGGRRRRVEDLRARVTAAERGHQRHDGGVVRGGVGDGVDRPARRGAGDQVADDRASRRRASAGSRRSALRRAVRLLRRAACRGRQLGHRLTQHATARHQRRSPSEKADRLPAALLIAAQSVLDQRDSQIADATFELVTGAADGRSVSSRWRSTIWSGTLSRLVVGVTPGDWYSRRCISRPIHVTGSGRVCGKGRSA